MRDQTKIKNENAATLNQVKLHEIMRYNILILNEMPQEYDDDVLSNYECCVNFFDRIKPDISNILNKIKAQNAARKADEVLNNQLSDSSEKEESDVTESGFTGESETKKKSYSLFISVFVIII